ncbi:alpha/beta hydrolase [Streptomyces sp. ODS28]|uniref:alpha/beta fold hydrolase n=1 Tax=Streptomyces sp. ODS28 TaxID=3136688 RepID=UPI0031E7E8D0
MFRMPLAYEDAGGDGLPLVALHGSFGRGANFARAARLLAERGVRLIAPDQRGHGHSPRTDVYDCDSFVADAAAFVRALDLGPLPVLGHSRGGVTAYQLAARHPGLVTSLVIEDIGPVVRSPEVPHPVLDVRGWPRTAPSREALGAAIEARGVPSGVVSAFFLQSAEPSPDGTHWRFLFDWDDMMAVQRSGCGDWWPDWLASTCPALVLRGARTAMLPEELAHDMVEHRPNTRLLTFPAAGHWLHDDAPEEFAGAVGDFLRRP